MQVMLSGSLLYLNLSSVPGWQELLDKGCGLCQWHGHKADHHQGGEDWRQGSIQRYKCKYSLAWWKYLPSGHLDRESKLPVPRGRPAGPFRLLHCLQLPAGVFLEGLVDDGGGGSRSSGGWEQVWLQALARPFCGWGCKDVLRSGECLLPAGNYQGLGEKPSSF